LKVDEVPPVAEEKLAPPRVQVRPAAHAPHAPEEDVHPAEKRSGWLWIVVGILLLGVVVAVVLFLRPYQPQYRPGLMYVVQSAVPADEAQTNSPAVAENVPVVTEGLPSASQEEKFSEPGAAVIVPPTPTKGTATETEKTAVKTEEKGVVKTEARPVREEPKAEPLKKVSGIAPAVAAPVVSGDVAAKSEPAPPVESAKPFIPVEEPPKIINLQQPVFSQEQIRAGVEGDVLVKVQIDQTGKPIQAKVVSSTNESLNASVIDAVMRSTYSPAVMSNGPVTTWMSIPLKLK
jgi:TonB family protein